MAAMTATVILLAAMVILWTLHRAALWAEARGWIYYRTRGNPHAAALSVMTLTSLYQPAVTYVIDEMTWERTEIVQTESGDGPD
jgi:hypothetical protein